MINTSDQKVPLLMINLYGLRCLVLFYVSLKFTWTMFSLNEMEYYFIQYCAVVGFVHIVS